MFSLVYQLTAYSKNSHELLFNLRSRFNTGLNSISQLLLKSRVLGSTKPTTTITSLTIRAQQIFKEPLNVKNVLSKPNVTQLNSKATSVGVRHRNHLEPTPPHTHTNFSATFRPARELKFGADTH